MSRSPSARQINDERLNTEISRVHPRQLRRVGIEKVWHQLPREGHQVGRDHVARLMDDLELSGVVRGKKKRTTIPAELSPRPADLVEGNFTAAAPNQLWVADLTYVSTWTGFVYVAFVVDVFSRFIVGWRVSTKLSSAHRLDRRCYLSRTLSESGWLRPCESGGAWGRAENGASRHGGTMNVRDGEDAGSTVTWWLPRNPNL